MLIYAIILFTIIVLAAIVPRFLSGYSKRRRVLVQQIAAFYALVLSVSTFMQGYENLASAFLSITVFLPWLYMTAYDDDLRTPDEQSGSNSPAGTSPQPGPFGPIDIPAQRAVN